MPKPIYAEISLGFDICRNIVSEFCRNPKSQIPNHCRNPKPLPKSQTAAEIPNWLILARIKWSTKNSFFGNSYNPFSHFWWEQNFLFGLCNVMWHKFDQSAVWDFGNSLGFGFRQSAICRNINNFGTLAEMFRHPTLGRSARRTHVRFYENMIIMVQPCRILMYENFK